MSVGSTQPLIEMSTGVYIGKGGRWVPYLEILEPQHLEHLGLVQACIGIALHLRPPNNHFTVC